MLLRRAYTMKFFFHRWLNFSFDSFISTFNTCTQLRNVNEIFQSTIMKVFQKKKFLPDFWLILFLLNYISRIKDQISIKNDVNFQFGVNTKEEMNEIQKHTYEKKRKKNQRDRLIKKTRKLLKWKVIGGNFFFFFLSGFSFTNIHDSRNSRGRGRVSI